jgi:hypothetical protein
LVQPFDGVVLRAISPKGGETVGKLKILPLKPDELRSAVNQLVNGGLIKITLNKNFLPCVHRVEQKPQSAPLPPPSAAPVAKERFEAAYWELERGKFYARICDLRRRLGWTVQEFDAMLTSLRDAGKIQLQAGGTNFTEEDIRDSFVDENGNRKLTMMWITGGTR